MAVEDVETGLLAEAAIEAFLAARGMGGHRRVPSLRSFAPLLDYLRSEALIVPVAGVPSTPVDEVVAAYEAWLVVERGLAAPTVLRYEKVARRFLSERVVGITEVSPESITEIPHP